MAGLEDTNDTKFGNRVGILHLVVRMHYIMTKHCARLFSDVSLFRMVDSFDLFLTNTNNTYTLLSYVLTYIRNR